MEDLRNEFPTILSWWLTLLAMIDYFPPIQRWSSVISLMRFGDRIGVAERVWDKKGLRLLYFTGACRRSLFYRWRHGYLWFRETGELCEDGRKRPNAGGRVGLQVYAAVCGQHYSPRALSAPPLIAVFVAAPTISLPSSYTSYGLFATSTRFSL